MDPVALFSARPYFFLPWSVFYLILPKQQNQLWISVMLLQLQECPAFIK